EYCRLLRDLNPEIVSVVQRLRGRTGENGLARGGRMQSVEREVGTERRGCGHQLRDAERNPDVAPIVQRAQIEVGETATQCFEADLHRHRAHLQIHRERLERSENEILIAETARRTAERDGAGVL